MKIKIPEKCQDCPFFHLEVYNYYKCELYKKLRNKFEVWKINKPSWCKAVEINIREK